MNRILYVARKAKGLTEKQVAEVLKIDESEYLEFECDIKTVSLDIRNKLEEFYDIHPSYFSLYDAFDVEERTCALKKYKEDLSSMVNLDIPAKIYIDIIKLGLESLLVHDELKVSFLRQLELEKENSVLRKLYDELRQSQKHSTKNRRSIDNLNK